MSMAVALGFKCYGSLFATLIFFVVRAATKNSMTVQIRSAKLEYANPEYMDSSAYVRASRKSRNSPMAMNMFFPFIKDLPHDMEFRYQALQKKRNAWQPTLVKGNLVACDVIHSDIKLFKDLFDRSNFPRKCPIKKGNYTFWDETIEDGSFPPATPAGSFVIRVSWSTPKANVLVCNVLLSIEKASTPGGYYSEAAASVLYNTTLG